jgi:putative tryptophan/tyrosine transport system substrate-binding protein
MAQGSHGGVLVMPNAFTVVHRERIVAQAERYRVPTIYPSAEFVTAGGLLSMGLIRRTCSDVPHHTLIAS